MFRHFRSFRYFVRRYGDCRHITIRRSVFGGFMLSSVHAKSSDTENNEKYEVDDSKLSPGYLTKMAAVQTATSATALLTHSLTVLLDVLDNYIHLLHNLLELMELHLVVYGNEYREDRVWDAMMEIRRQISECKQEKQELEVIFLCAEKALQAAGEAAHITGAEYAGMMANECVYSATSQLKQKQLTVEEVESKLRQMEVKSIEEISKKEDKANKKVEEDTVQTSSGETQNKPDNEDHTSKNHVQNQTEHNEQKSDQADGSDETEFVIVNRDDWDVNYAKESNDHAEDMSFK